MDEVLAALSRLRVPIQQGEYDLHRLVEQALDEAGIPWRHEVKLGSRCRIDLMAGGVGIEIKRGRPERGRLLEQLSRYAACPEVQALVLVVERSAALPHTLQGKPVRVLCLNRLWGIAL